MQNVENLDFGRPRRRWDDKIETDLTEIVYELDSGASLKITTSVEVLVKESTDFFFRTGEIS
jgi:hypothetical protein